MGGLQEPCNILAGNCSAHGVHNSKWFGKCAFILKKGAVVRKLLHRKVGKVPKSRCWGGGGVMWKWCAPNPSPKCMQLLGEHHYIPFQLQIQRKDEGFSWCLFFAPAKCAPTFSHIYTMGGVCDARLPFRQFFDSSHTKLIKCQCHHLECAQEQRAAFLWVFIEGKQNKSGKIACFGGAQKQPCGLCCTTAVSWVLWF